MVDLSGAKDSILIKEDARAYETLPPEAGFNVS
jgi:hypothetical protein